MLELEASNEKAWFRHGQACFRLKDFSTALTSFKKVPVPGILTVARDTVSASVLVLEEELPMAPLGPLRECLHPVVLYTSILSPTLTPSRCESPVQLCVFCTCA